jgi:Spy/CpxP family protein refolding chaperone
MILASAAVAAGLTFAAASHAQTAPQVPPQAAAAAQSPAQAPPAARPPRAHQAGAMRQGAGRLNLTEAQRDQIRTLRDAQRKDSQVLRERMRVARQQLRQAMRADVPDEAAVRAAAAAVGALQADGAAQRARSRAGFMKILTPEQQAQLKGARARAAQRAQRAMRAERQMMRRNRMMRPGPALGRGPGMGPMGAPMTGPMWRQWQLRQDALRRWRGWI